MNYREKLETEKKAFHSKDKAASAVMPDVATALLCFAEQDTEFAQAIEQSAKTLQDCCEASVKGCGQSISDLEVYKRAVKIYFATADVHFEMKIDLCAGNGHQAPPITRTDCQPKSLSVSLDDLLDF